MKQFILKQDMWQFFLPSQLSSPILQEQNSSGIVTLKGSEAFLKCNMKLKQIHTLTKKTLTNSWGLTLYY